MRVSLDKICNIKPIRKSSRRVDYKAIYTLFCGIESEYAISVLKKNKEDKLFKDISSCFLTIDTSVKDLFFDGFNQDDEALELHKRLQFEEGDDSYLEVLKNIEWESTDTENKYTIGDFSFPSNKLFLDLKEKDGEYYALCVQAGEKNDEFVVIGSKEDEHGLNYKTNSNIINFLKVEEIDFTKYKLVDAPQLTYEQFFQITTKLKEADDEQKSAISADIDKNLLIIAGAGSGKTRSLVGRLTYLHTVKSIPLNRIILLTFTRAATSEMGASALQQIKEAYRSCGMPATRNPQVQASTIDSFFKQIIDKYFFDVGLVRKPVFLLDENRMSDRLGLLTQVIRENHLGTVFKSYFENGSCSPLLYHALEDVLNGKVVNISGIENLLDLFVQKQIDDCVIVDFAYTGCIIKKALEDKNCPLYKRLADLYDCILIDEFQDINKLQNNVLSCFYNSPIHFTFVGDDDQTIYTWRGADNSIIKDMSKDKNVRTIYLTINYRNNPYIVKAGNDILEAIDDRAKVGRPITPAKKTGCKVKVTRYDAKYENLANEIKKVYDSRSAGEKICVLCRQVNDKEQFIDGQRKTIEGEGSKIARMLKLLSVKVDQTIDDKPYYSEGYKVFKALVYILNKIDVRNNCAYIKELTGTSASNTNIRKLVFGKSTSQSFERSSEAFNMETISKLANSINTQYTYAGNFHDLISNYNRVFSSEVQDLYNKDREVQDDALIVLQQKSENYNWPYPMAKAQLKNIFGNLEEEIVRIRRKLVVVNEENNPNNPETSKDAVIISSIHKAKGLQYDTVFIVGLNDGECPNISRIYTDYNKSVSQFQRLKVSQENLNRLRASIGKETIVELLKECRSDLWQNESDPELVRDMNDMAEDIEACAEEYIELSDDGVNDFLDAFDTYITQHIAKRRDLINKKNNEIAVIQETADAKEEEFHEAEDDSEEAEKLNQDWENLLSEVKEKKLSLARYKNRLDDFLLHIANLRSFYEICNEAKGYLADVKKLRNEEIMIKKLEKEKEDKVREEKRLFYVAVSRASEKLYLCVKQGATESEFIQLIKPENRENYTMLTKYQEDELDRLAPYIQELKEETEKDLVNDKKIEKSVERILNASDAFKGEISEYLNKYIAEHPQYNNLPSTAKVYFNNIIQLVALSEKLGLSFKEATAHYILKFVHQMLLEKIGKKAKSFKTDTNSATKIMKDIRKIAINGCKVTPPGEGYLIDLLTKEPKYSGNDFERCKSLVIQCYVVCSGKYRVPDYILGTWGIKSFNKDKPEDFLVAALDLTNIRNTMIHDKMELWSTDYLPYAFECMDTIMLYIGQPINKTIQYNDDIDIEENIVAQKLYTVLTVNKGMITDFKKLYSLINDFFDVKIAKALCIIDAKIMKDIISGIVNTRRGTDAAYLRNMSHYSNEMCLKVLAVWEDVIDSQTTEILKKII